MRIGAKCYRRMIEIYGGGNVSTCGFSSGGALAIGMALYNNTLAQKLPMPEHIVAVSPGEVPWNDKEKLLMKALNDRDVMIDYDFMKKVEKFMRHRQKNVPEYMLSGTKGDYSGINDITFFYSTDEVLYGAKDMFVDACKRYGVKYKVYERPGMVHCYPFLPYYHEAKEDFNIIVDILS